MAGKSDTISTNGTVFNSGDTLSVTITTTKITGGVNGTLYIGETEIPISSNTLNYTYDYVLTNTGTFNVHFINNMFELDSNNITITVNATTNVVSAFVNRLKSVFVQKNDITDNLTSTNTTKPLSANQGKVLNEKIIGTNTFYGTTSTTASTQVKQVTVADTNFTLAEGTVLVLKSTTAQTYNASSTKPVKLCVNNGIDVPVQYINENYSSRYMWSANEIVELVYDGTNWILLNNGLATTTYYGVTKLNNTVTSTSTSLSATANSVKTAYDKGVEAYALAEGKQDMLVSGTNIKTVNNESLLGDGNITVQGGTDVTVDSELSSSSTNPVRNSVITNALNNKSDSSHTHSNYNKATYSQTLPSSTNGAYEIGTITIDGASTTLYGKDTDTVYTHPTYQIYGSTMDIGLYKIKTNILGHIIATTQATSTDIADLGVEITDTVYTHPTYTPKNSGLYKITVDSTGHISGTASVGANDLPSHTHSQYLTSHQDITGKEDISNKVTSMTAISTDDEYPSAKCVHDELESLFEDTIDELIEYGESL